MEPSNLTNSVQYLSAVSEFRVAQGYFSDILNAQLIIFSLILGAIVALYAFFNYRIQKEIIQKEVKKIIEKRFEAKFTKELSRHDKLLTLLKASVERAMGEFWSSEKSYVTAFVWWIRAAYDFFQGGNEPLTRGSLGAAKESVEKILDASQLSAKDVSEYHRLIPEIDDKTYGKEKQLLDNAFRNALTRTTTK
ncbi:MAG: hypothetical protein Q7S23_05470 [bacterium]|nr:hypothetical protein [bacterium]